ncbi:MAG: orotidine-5'-phosphate decarboxylase [Burkholderiaceae bacterium]|jgi:orotidine-5'-phosphate decarboxylase|nr:orotidine-5'-phosphate decarboxylase [Burkholderiaceae bacterium]MEB2318811.1 orotidine-5'-phosphate decarboxylase [Pseudomonadota bacterium]
MARPKETRLTFTSKMRAIWSRTDSMLCVGLDPAPAKFPAALADGPDRIARFCIAIADATAPYACAFKPQIAYFAAERAEDQLEAVCAHIRRAHPDIPVILDAKRGDIGATAEQYAREAFERYGADAVTVNPYMGHDSIEPWLERADKGVFLLCRTSNPGGDDLQSLALADGSRLYERVAELAAGRWNRNGQLGLVVGATYPAELARVRELAPALPLLVPGIGAQGGDVEASVAAGRCADGYGMLINSSRAILYAGAGEDFAAAAGEAARLTRDAIRQAHR